MQGNPPMLVIGNPPKRRPPFHYPKGSPEAKAHMARLRAMREAKRGRSVPEQHQIVIARRTLEMPDPMAGVMGGPSKAEAREILRRFRGNPLEECRMCGGPLVRLGQLGTMMHYRCQDCGLSAADELTPMQKSDRPPVPGRRCTVCGIRMKRGEIGDVCPFCVRKGNPRSRRALLAEARHSLALAGADVRAGHRGAAEYWQGRAAGLSQAALANPGDFIPISDAEGIRLAGRRRGVQKGFTRDNGRVMAFGPVARIDYLNGQSVWVRLARKTRSALSGPYCSSCGITLRPGEGFQGKCPFCVREGNPRSLIAEASAMNPEAKFGSGYRPSSRKGPFGIRMGDAYEFLMSNQPGHPWKTYYIVGWDRKSKDVFISSMHPSMIQAQAEHNRIPFSHFSGGLRISGIIRRASRTGNPYGPSAQYTHHRQLPPGMFTAGSFRTIRLGRRGAKGVIGRLRGSRKTRLQSILRPKNPGAFRGLPPFIANDPAFRAELAAYRKRHGNGPVRISAIKTPAGFPKFISAYGKAPEIKYDAPAHSNKGKRIHKFGESGGSTPWLVTSVARGPKFLAFVGGTFRAKDWLYR